MPTTRTSSGLDLLLPVDPASPEPLHRQLGSGLRQAIRSGRLEGGLALPSSRALARQLGVSRGVVVEAYEQLVAEGYLVSRPGGTTRVAPGLGVARREAADLEPEVPAFDFRPGRPDVAEFPRAAWVRALRRALDAAPANRLGYLGSHGVPELRLALAAYLNRVRGTVADPANVVITTGFAQALGVLATTLAARGARRFAMEDPFAPEYRGIVARAGLEVVPIPVDTDGMRVDRLDAARVDAVLVTAAHQYPVGGVLPPERRTALLDWSRRTGGLVVEDDYDAEFRYDRDPVGALQGLAPSQVVYAGSASKTLAPGVRLGWLIPPSALADALVATKEAADQGSQAMDQLALAELLANGDVDRHLRRMRPIYRRRRDALLGALEEHLPELEATGAAAGLHLLAWLPADVDEAAVVGEAVAAGIAISGVTPRRAVPGRPGLIFGYGGIPESRIEPGVTALAGIIRRLATRAPGARSAGSAANR
jgi:GntR family transcriptional regulator/MocR family aminotransferase